MLKRLTLYSFSGARVRQFSYDTVCGIDAPCAPPFGGVSGASSDHAPGFISSDYSGSTMLRQVERAGWTEMVIQREALALATPPAGATAAGRTSIDCGRSPVIGGESCKLHGFQLRSTGLTDRYACSDIERPDTCSNGSIGFSRVDRFSCINNNEVKL